MTRKKRTKFHPPPTEEAILALVFALIATVAIFWKYDWDFWDMLPGTYYVGSAKQFIIIIAAFCFYTTVTMFYPHWIKPQIILMAIIATVLFFT